MSSVTCAITGANGFIGSHLVNFFRARQCHVIEMTRENHFDLSKTPPDLHGVDVLIHAAYDLKIINHRLNKKINYEGSVNLLRHAKKCGVKKIIFISSLSAFEGTRSLYGRTKLAIESVVAELGGVIVRPGLVFDENPRGIVGAMNKFIQHSKIIPLIGKGQQKFYPCHVQDLVELLFYLANSIENYTKPIIAAADHAMTFKEIVTFLATKQHKKIVLCPVPYFILLFGMKLMEKLGLNIGLRSDSLVGAQYYNPNPDFSATKCILRHTQHLLPLSFRDLK